jgi:signal peptidase I, archaeal type
MAIQGVARPEYRPRHSPAPAGVRRRRPRVGTIVVAVLVAALAAVVLTFWQRGYSLYLVHTGSMVPTYDPGDLVLDGPPSGHYKPGEVITFRHSAFTTDVVTHRIVAVTPSGLIHTKGDANRTADVWQIRPDQVQGTAVARLRGLGYLVVFLRQPAGIGSLAAMVLAIVLLWGLFFGERDGPSDAPRTQPQPSRTTAQPQPAS